MNLRNTALLAMFALSALACGKGDVDKAKKVEQLIASSESVLPAGKVKELLSGNTLIGKRYGKDETFRYFHGKDGKAQMLGGKELAGKWRVKDDGAYCLAWEGKPEKCRYVANDGKGGMQITNDVRKVVWIVEKISPGKQ